MKRAGLILSVIVFTFLLISFVGASVQEVIINQGNQNYDYAVIGKTYNLFVAGENLLPVNHHELKLLSNDGTLSVYEFTPNKTSGLRTFVNGSTIFEVNVISQADEIAEAIGNVVIEINNTRSSVRISGLDFSGKTIEMAQINGVGSGSINISSLLAGFTFDLGFVKNEKYPLYHNLFIDGGSSAGTVVGAILISKSLGFDVNAINNDPELINQVIDSYGAVLPYPANARVIKEGNSFYFSTDEGYSSLNGTHLERIKRVIERGTELITPDQIIESLLPINNFSDFKEFLDFEVVGIDYGNLELKVGTYTLEMLYTDKHGNTGSKEFTIILNIPHTVFEKPLDGKIIFTDPIVIETIEKMEKLPDNVNVTVVLHGKNKPSSFAIVTTKIKQALNFIEIKIDGATAENVDFFFRVGKSSIDESNKDNVRLYVQEGSEWRELSTVMIGETLSQYQYRATIPHFSSFMIGVSDETPEAEEEEEIFTGGGSIVPISDSSPPSSQESPTIPLDLSSGPEEQGFFARLTGAVVGALGTGGSIFLITFIFSLIGLMVILRIKRCMDNDYIKKKKVNEKRNKVEL